MLSDFPYKISFFVLLFFVFGSLNFAKAGIESNSIAIFRIDRGDSLTDISQRLKETGLIRSTGFFKLYTFIIGAAHRFQPGVYQLEKNGSLTKIVRALIIGPQPVDVIISEGASLQDIDFKLSEAGIIRRGDLVKFSLSPEMNELKKGFWFTRDKKMIEGFLFPDTYRFMPGADPSIIMKTFLDNFSGKAIPLLSKAKDWYNIVILASLLEREVPLNNDRMLVAGIVRKRLALGMPLQIDATIFYIKCEEGHLSCKNRQLTKSDFNIDSDYNTYTRKGLPPAPISNPGVEAIKAALNPKKSSYLFYLSDSKTQRTIYSRTFEEHDENRSKYLRI